MRSHFVPVVFGVLAGAALASASPAEKAPATASEFYLRVLSIQGAMKSLDELKPYMPKEQAKMIDGIPKDGQSEMLAEMKKQAVTGVRIVKESPFDGGFLLQAEGTRKADKVAAKGWAQIVKEDGAFKLKAEDWSGAPPPSPPVAPKIPATVTAKGSAVGEWTVNGKTAPLKYAWAQSKPDSFDAKKIGYRLILSDVPWNAEDYNHGEKVTAGTLHYVELDFGFEKQVYGTMLYHGGFKDTNYLSSAGGSLQVDIETLGPDVLAGKVYMKAPEDSMGGVRYYAATFRAAVEKPKN